MAPYGGLPNHASGFASRVDIYFWGELNEQKRKIRTIKKNRIFLCLYGNVSFPRFLFC